MVFECMGDEDGRSVCPEPVSFQGTRFHFKLVSQGTASGARPDVVFVAPKPLAAVLPWVIGGANRTVFVREKAGA